jgi:type II secretory pathway pseudopilin PulG
LLVVIAIIAVLGAMLLPVLGQARRSARITACTSQLRQQGVAHAMYQDDFEGYFPLFGGEVALDQGAKKSDEHHRPWLLSGEGAAAYRSDYQPDVRIDYCTAVTFRTFGPSPKSVFGAYTFMNPANTPYHTNAVGYNFYTGRISGKKTGSHHDLDTISIRADPAEIIATDHFNRWIWNADIPYAGDGTAASTSSPWLSPHHDRSAQPVPLGSMNQLLADGSVHRVNMQGKILDGFGYLGYTRSYFVGEKRGRNSEWYFAYNSK